MSSREQFEAWWEINYHNGNPPRFGWAAWRDGDGYKIDDDESELDGMWQAWQAAHSSRLEALEKRIAELMEKQRLIDICQGQGLEHRIAAEKRAEEAEQRLAELESREVTPEVGVMNIGNPYCEDRLVAWTVAGKSLPPGIYYLEAVWSGSIGAED